MKFMRKIAFTLCALAAVLCIVSVKPAKTEAAAKYYVTTKSSSLTKKASAKSSKVASVASGQLVMVKDTSNKSFYKVSYKKHTGYIPKANLKKVTTYKTTAKTPLYKTKSTSGKKVTTIPKGSSVCSLGTSGSFRKVAYITGNGKVYTGYVEKTSTKTSAASKSAKTTNTVNLRAAAKEGSDVLCRVGRGSKVKILDTSNRYWTKVSYVSKEKHKTYTGYISNRYLKK